MNEQKEKEEKKQKNKKDNIICPVHTLSGVDVFHQDSVNVGEIIGPMPASIGALSLSQSMLLAMD